MEPIQFPAPVRSIADLVADQGGRALLVGGGVRDHLMGRTIVDWDLEVYGIPEKSLAKLLKRVGSVNAVGRQFGVLKVRVEHREIDVSIPRRDSKAGPGHRGIQVEGDPFLDPREAARRRDLTINAVMVDVRTQELLDPHGGLRDIADRKLKAVDAGTFLEDPLRALRVVQFAARLDFAPDDELMRLCRQADLHELPAERVQGEWLKLLTKGERPSRGMAVARGAHVLERVFPEAVDDPRIDLALDRLALLRERMAGEGRQYAAMLLVWLHRTPFEGVTATLDRLWLHHWGGYAVRDQLCKAHPHWRDPMDSDAALRHLSHRCDVTVALLARAAIDDDPAAEAALTRAQELCVQDASPTPILKGRHLKTLGLQDGPRMGEVLKRVYALQLDGSVTGLDTALDAARRILEQGS